MSEYINLENKATEKWYHIEKDLIPVKLCYLFLYLKDSTVAGYLTLYLTATGLSVTDAGLIGAASCIALLSSGPLWGAVADKWHNYKILTAALSILSMVTMAIQPPVASRLMKHGINENVTWSEARANQSTSNSSYERNQQQFLFSLFINIVMNIFDGALFGLADSAVVSVMRTRVKPINFGRQRLFGCIGFGVGTLICSASTSIFKRWFPSMPKYSAVFYLFCIFTAGFCVNFFYLVKHVEVNEEKKQKHESGLIHCLIKEIFNVRAACFWISIILIGISLGLHEAFCLKLLEEMESPNVILGATFAMASVANTIALYFSDQIVTLLNNTMVTISLATLAYAIRFLTYGYSYSPYAILCIQVTHGIGFGLLSTAAVMHIKQTSPATLNATMYGLFNSLHYGAGPFIAFIVGGVLYDHYGGHNVFAWSGYLCLSWTAVTVLYVAFNRRKNVVRGETDTLI